MDWKMIAKKWYVIFICAIVCSGGLYFEKSRVAPIVPQTGDMTYIRVVKFDKIPTFTVSQTSTEIDLTNLMKSWSNLIALQNNIEEKMVMKKFNPEWFQTADSQKIKWMSEHFRIQHLGPGLYELIIQFTKKDAKDSQYVEENHDLLMDTYMSSFKQSASIITDNTDLTIVQETQHIDVSKNVTKTDSEKKYAIIGFVLGALVGLVLVVVWTGRKRESAK